MTNDTLVSLPKYGYDFVLHMNASGKQIGGILLQEGKYWVFLSQKFNLAQTKYLTSEQELIAIVDTLKAFQTIILG